MPASFVASLFCSQPLLYVKKEVRVKLQVRVMGCDGPPNWVESGSDGIRIGWNQDRVESGSDGIRIGWNQDWVESESGGICFYTVPSLMRFCLGGENVDAQTSHKYFRRKKQ